MEKEKQFFSVPLELIVVGSPIPYNIYVNSAGGTGRIHFLKAKVAGSILTQAELLEIKNKYFQIYIGEEEREKYINGLVNNKNVTKEKKTEIIKESAIKYLDKVFDPNRKFSTEVLEETIIGCKDSVENLVTVIGDLQLSDLQKLIGSLSFHDFYTFDHSINVSMYTILILKEIDPNATKEEQVLAGLGGMLHDIGKIKIPLNIINKAGKLDDNEFNQIKSHPERGKELIESQHLIMKGIDFNTIKNIVYQHHENFNGTGYPQKLSGEQIDRYARIVAIADFFDAVTTHRAYHEALSLEDALAVMKNSCGKKIDPNLFEAFKKTVKDIGMGKSYLSVSDEYDPCQPHNVLPFVNPSAKKQEHDLFGKKEEKKIGKVKKVA